ncbi:MAG: tetratricopeptide repeat protein [Polyangiaceae bacterium]
MTKTLEPLVEHDLEGAAEPTPTVLRLLNQAPPEEVRLELTRLDALDLDGAAAAARRYAHGALALREGRVEAARQAFEEAAEVFEAAGDAEAAALAACEGWLAVIRRGPRKVYDGAAEALAEIQARAEDGGWRAVEVVAAHYRGTALRYAGRAEATLDVLLAAFARSDGLLSERAQVLNSLGTLYVVLGAFGAAESVLAHAAEINHQRRDLVSEAISYGQLGSAAMGRGDLDAARRYLQKQEWFASRVGDNFGRARALVLLGDLAIDRGRPDDAIELAMAARRIAESVTPPLGMWVAYATRTIGRAKLEVGDADAEAELTLARERMAAIGNQLGEALVRWDLAHLAARRGTIDPTPWGEAAWAFAGLGLSGRVAQIMADRAALDEAAGHEAQLALAAIAQGHPHLAQAQEVDLVLTEPAIVAAMATRRIAGQRNVARLSALTLAPPGLYLAVVVADAIEVGQALPSRRAEAALVGRLPGAVLWAWPGATSVEVVCRDLSGLRAALGEGCRAALQRFADARVKGAPFSGELGAELEGASLVGTLATAVGAAADQLCVDAAIDLGGEAEAIARMSGFDVVR